MAGPITARTAPHHQDVAAALTLERRATEAAGPSGGATGRPDQAPVHPAVPGAPDRAPSHGGPDSLDDVLDRLNAQYFAGNERALGAILTRVALRTGADLRAPRPDQRTDPAVIADVLAVLQVMGYVVQSSAEDLRLVQNVDPQGPPRDSATSWWRRALPGLFRE